MKKNVTEFTFRDTFNKVRPNSFSYYGLTALYNYLIEYEDATGEEIELDVIALCGDFSEFEDLKEIQEQYPDIKSIEDLQEHTQVIEFSEDNPFMEERTSGIIIQNY